MSPPAAGRQNVEAPDEVDPSDYEWLQHQLQQAQLGDDDDEDWDDPSGGVLSEVFDACESGKADVLKQLITQLTTDINTPGPDGDSAIHIACLYGHLDCVELLLEAGADANIVNDDDGSTPLHDAAAGGYLDICKLILSRAHADSVNVKDSDNETPLHTAARGNHLEVVELLLSKGANPSIKNADGNTPLEEAEDEPVVKRLQTAQQGASASGALA